MIYVQITGGRGPVECAAAVNKVTAAVTAYIEQTANCAPTVVEQEPHNQFAELNMSITLSFECDNRCTIEEIKRNWEGTVKYIAIKNCYRPNHKRKNWFVGVHFFEKSQLPTIDDRDIRYETLRSSGHGGQNVNKVESAVRAVHIPTGTSVVCHDERDQPRNKALARERLLIRLMRMAEQTTMSENREVWLQHCSLERGNAVQTLCGPL